MKSIFPLFSPETHLPNFQRVKSDGAEGVTQAPEVRQKKEVGKSEVNNGEVSVPFAPDQMRFSGSSQGEVQEPESTIGTGFRNSTQTSDVERVPG